MQQPQPNQPTNLSRARARLQVYPEPLRSFATDAVPAPVTTIPVVAEGRAALEHINKARAAGGVAGWRAAGGWHASRCTMPAWPALDERDLHCSAAPSFTPRFFVTGLIAGDGAGL